MTEKQRASGVKHQQAEEEERLVEKKTLNVILHSLHGVKGRRERGEKKERQEQGKRKRGEGEEGDKRESLTWRQTAFQNQTANHTDTHKISTPQVAQKSFW